MLPATSANLGPAFDAAALAFGLFLKIQRPAADEFSITASGRDEEICGRIENHLILTTYREVLEPEGKAGGRRLLSTSKTRFPSARDAVPRRRRAWQELLWQYTLANCVGRTAGSSEKPHAGSIIPTTQPHAGWADSRWRACLDEGEAQVACVIPKGKWPLLLAVPDEALATEEARRVLPSQYSRADAVTNVQNSMLFLAAFVQGRRDLLASALEDRMHQPYRAALCPLLPALQKLAEVRRAFWVRC